MAQNTKKASKGKGGSKKRKAASPVEDDDDNITVAMAPKEAELTKEQEQARREDLELLRTHFDMNSFEATRRAELFNDKMIEVCRIKNWTPKPAISGKDFTTRARDLAKEGITRETLEEQCFPKKVPATPSKKKKGSKSG
ncbi:hypothetical protein LTR37_002836 [Vermiconidia calcicola]|uniref:Uncharacterized protein n=1 Tax=Vermiconidia calcicola TaxID=1690605 RepID=A0ACC3NSW2_9PEZI|nr:hypothetical protein LTR37_002836 [Vermiconidia calcicola]